MYRMVRPMYGSLTCYIILAIQNSCIGDSNSNATDEQCPAILLQDLRRLKERITCSCYDYFERPLWSGRLS